MIFLRVKVNFDIASILLLLWETCIYFDIAIAMFPLYKKKMLIFILEVPLRQV